MTTTEIMGDINRHRLEVAEQVLELISLYNETPGWVNATVSPYARNRLAMYIRRYGYDAVKCMLRYVLSHNPNPRAYSMNPSAGTLYWLLSEERLVTLGESALATLG